MRPWAQSWASVPPVPAVSSGWRGSVGVGVLEGQAGALLVHVLGQGPGLPAELLLERVVVVLAAGLLELRQVVGLVLEGGPGVDGSGEVAQAAYCLRCCPGVVLLAGLLGLLLEAGQFGLESREVEGAPGFERDGDGCGRGRGPPVAGTWWLLLLWFWCGGHGAPLFCGWVVVAGCWWTRGRLRGSRGCFLSGWLRAGRRQVGVGGCSGSLEASAGVSGPSSGSGS